MIKISKSDSIVDVISKINNSKSKDIILEFPFGHPIIHNYLSLKILKNQAWSKNLVIATSDLSSKKIWRKLWIKYSIIKDPKFIEERNLLKHNFTFFEYLKYEIKKYWNEIKEFVFLNEKIRKVKDYKEKYSNKSGIWFFLLWLLISIFVFIFIFYLAVNKTYIYVTPEISVKTKSKNFTFKESSDEQIIEEEKIIRLKELSENIYLEELFWTTGIKEDEIRKSKWEILIINKTPEDIKLLPNTRVKTASWVVFEIDWWSTIPKANIDSNWKIKPWTTKASVIAKIYDEDWKIIWERWNIKNKTILTIPWLKDDKNKVYARSIEDFKWWSSKIKKIISEDDIEKGKKIIEEKLKKESLKKIKQIVKQKNKEDSSKYEILAVNEAIRYSNLNIIPFWDIKQWDEVDKFKLTWSIKVNIFLYNKETVINKLKNTVRNSILEDIEEINLIDSDSLRISNIISKKDSPFEMKATVEIEILLNHNFLSENNAYIERLKATILWLESEKAKKVLLNNSKISNVTIENRPFFIKEITSIPENIIFKVQE